MAKYAIAVIQGQRAGGAGALTARRLVFVMVSTHDFPLLVRRQL
jgi:hypothetical protein